MGGKRKRNRHLTSVEVEELNSKNEQFELENKQPVFNSLQNPQPVWFYSNNHTNYNYDYSYADYGYNSYQYPAQYQNVPYFFGDTFSGRWMPYSPQYQRTAYSYQDPKRHRNNHSVNPPKSKNRRKRHQNNVTSTNKVTVNSCTKNITVNSSSSVNNATVSIAQCKANEIPVIPLGNNSVSLPQSNSVAAIQKKLVIVGDSACGKTCLLIVFKGDKYPLGSIPKLFVNRMANVEVGEKRVELALWDMACQDDFNSLRKFSYSNADVVLVCFSVDDRKSFQSVLKQWVLEVRLHCKNTPIILVGNKKDLRDDTRTTNRLARMKQKPVSHQEGVSVAQKIGACEYLECSAKNLEGIGEILQSCGQAALRERNTDPHAQDETVSAEPGFSSSQATPFNRAFDSQNGDILKNLQDNCKTRWNDMVRTEQIGNSTCNKAVAPTRSSSVGARSIPKVSMPSVEVVEENEKNKEDDVHYLYMVKPDNDRLVALIDLSEESQTKNQEFSDAVPENSYISVNTDSNSISADKCKTSHMKSAKEDVHCQVCSESFLELQANKCDLYIARCGHLFCMSCIKLKNMCLACKVVITNLRRIFL